jgi:sugar phosphate isomerase/epimerase
MEPDVARALDEFAILAEMADDRGLLATIEFAPIQVINSLAAALEVVRHVARDNFGLLIDAMHFFRSGATLDELRTLAPGTIRYAQLCDVPMTPPHDDYLREAMNERLAPGAGELPLAAFIAALPGDIPIGLEVPNLAAAQSGIDPVERLRPAVAAARKYLEGH